jgi:hypothetical protein
MISTAIYLFLSTLHIVEARICKAVAGTSSWPSDSAWAKLNTSLSGALIRSVPPGGICHQGQPNYNITACPTIASLWTTSWDFHEDDPVSVAYNNWNNDTCLPSPSVSCSDVGYPVYVVNATTSEHVQAGVNFARENNVRLVVKASGHDFRGRSVAPNALSIWTRNLKGLIWSDQFQVQTGNLSCQSSYTGPALTFAAGEDFSSAFAFVDQHETMINAGGDGSVNPVGYTTGGGHSVISAQKGLSADNTIELAVVLPSGDIVIANECTNSDIFWGLRGGGGSTLGVVLNTTMKALPSETLTSLEFGMGSPTNNDELFWKAMTVFLNGVPQLMNAGGQFYATVALGNATSPSLLQCIFNTLSMSVKETAALILPLLEQINSTFAGQVITEALEVTTWPSYYTWWIANFDTTTPIGVDFAMGSRILDAQALENANAGAYIKAAASVTLGGLEMIGVGGPGTHAFADDFNAVNPAWRTGYVHTSKII